MGAKNKHTIHIERDTKHNNESESSWFISISFANWLQFSFNLRCEYAFCVSSVYTKQLLTNFSLVIASWNSLQWFQFDEICIWCGVWIEAMLTILCQKTVCTISMVLIDIAGHIELNFHWNIRWNAQIRFFNHCHLAMQYTSIGRLPMQCRTI